MAVTNQEVRVVYGPSDYQSSPSDIDPHKIQEVLPSWSFMVNGGGKNRAWVFQEPRYKLSVSIRSDMALISGAALTSDSAAIYQLMLVEAQVRPDSLSLGFYGADASLYLIKRLPEQRWKTDYELSFSVGRNVRVLGPLSLRERIIQAFHPSPPSLSHFSWSIPKSHLVTV